MGKENQTPQSEQITENIWLCPDGVYRWSYEFDMLRNPTILITVFKVLGISCGAVFLFTFFVDLFSGSIQSWGDLRGPGLLFLVMAAILLVLGVLSYLIVAAIFGWKYMVLFEMTDQYVKHIQMPKQVQKAEALGWLTTFVGIMAKQPVTAGAGLLAASKNTSTSVFENVAVVKVRRRRHAIHVNQLLDKNQVYAEDVDFDFVEKFILDRCTKAKIK